MDGDTFIGIESVCTHIYILPKDVESSALSLLWCEACGTRGFFLQCFLISVSLPFYPAVAQVSHMIVSYPKTLKTFPLDWKYSFTLTECERCICSILYSDKVTKIGFGFGSLRKVLISYVHLRSIMAMRNTSFGICGISLRAQTAGTSC